MLVRLLGAKEQGDLSPYRDLNPAAWYNRELSAAVSLGIFNGVSATQMAPHAVHHPAGGLHSAGPGLRPVSPGPPGLYPGSGTVSGSSPMPGRRQRSGRGGLCHRL